jgi:ribonuclease D
VKLKGAASTGLPEQIVSQPAQLTDCVEHLNRCSRIGLDTEFVGEQSYRPQLCLIQIATDDGLYLIDPLTVGPLDAFWEMLVAPGKEVILHAGREDIRICLLACGRAPSDLVDLQLAAGLVGFTYPMGHGSLVKELLGITLQKGETLTEWGVRPLTRSQLRYAFDDVRFLLPIWDRLSPRLDELDRRDWVRQECARLATNAATNTPEDAASSEKWRKLRGAGSLDRRRLAVVRELFAWREAMAAKVDRPPRTVVRDDLVIEIARRMPTGERDLQVIRGLPKRDFPALLEIVERCRELPPDQCPALPERDQDPPRIAIVTAVLMAMLSDLCIRRRLAANLTASTSDIKMLVRSHSQGLPLPEESQLTHGWRKQHILPDVLAVLEGRRSLRVADVTAESPLAYDS